jgi:hypothetical protein
MRINELVKSLKKLGEIDVPEGTIKRWAYTERTIRDTPPQPVQKGRGKASNWPEAALEEAAAVWAVRHYAKNTARLSPQVIKYVNEVANHLYMSPLAYYTLPSVVGPLLRFRQISYEDVIVQFATDEAPVLNLVPGKNYAQKIDLLNELIATWISAREKVRFSKKWGHVKAKQRENNRKVIMRINGKSEEISATWPVEMAARIYLSYKFARFEPQGLALIGSGGHIYPLNATVDRVYLFDRSYIVPSRRNEVILLENEVDTRKLFIIADATEDKRFLEDARSEQLAELPQFEVQA